MYLFIYIYVYIYLYMRVREIRAKMLTRNFQSRRRQIVGHWRVFAHVIRRRSLVCEIVSLHLGPRLALMWHNLLRQLHSSLTFGRSL
jgi:hypothetical protein